MLLDGKAPLPGQLMVFPKLARTFRDLVSKGKDGFYKGRIAQAIVDHIKAKGGVMELEDLANHRSTFVKPIKYTYAGDITVYEVPSFVAMLLHNIHFHLSVRQMARESQLCLLWVSWRRSRDRDFPDH